MSIKSLSHLPYILPGRSILAMWQWDLGLQDHPKDSHTPFSPTWIYDAALALSVVCGYTIMSRDNILRGLKGDQYLFIYSSIVTTFLTDPTILRKGIIIIERQQEQRQPFPFQTEKDFPQATNTSNINLIEGTTIQNSSQPQCIHLYSLP